MTDRELMQQALEALSGMLTHMGMDEDDWNKPTFDRCRKAEVALRERMAQPEFDDALQSAAMTQTAPKLTQPEQEPVAWVCEGSSSDEKHAIDYQQEDVDAIPIGTLLYTAPPQQEKQSTMKPTLQEVQNAAANLRLMKKMFGEQAEWQPVAWLHRDYYGNLKVAQIEPPPPLAFPVYTAPPQRKPLADEELKKIWYAMQNISFHEIARAIEAAHGIKEKNGGGV